MSAVNIYVDIIFLLSHQDAIRLTNHQVPRIDASPERTHHKPPSRPLGKNGSSTSARQMFQRSIFKLTHADSSLVKASAESLKKKRKASKKPYFVISSPLLYLDYSIGIQIFDSAQDLYPA